MELNIIKNKENAIKLLVSIFKKGSFIPFIGSGFSSGVSTKKNGQVPNLEKYKEHMLSLIFQETDYPEEDKKEIKEKDFFSIAQLYEELPDNFDLKKDEYHKKNFVNAILDKKDPSQKLKQEFLQISWPYIYTINYDDVIENSSDYSKKVLANENVKETIFDDYKCTIKLHGDACNFSYYNNCHFVRGIQQYVKTLKNNFLLYDKLRNDFNSQNIFFIGCSLNNELDLLSITQELDSEQLYNNKVMFSLTEPSALFKKNLKRYLITDIIVVNNHNEIYSFILEAWRTYLIQEQNHDLLYNYKKLKTKILLKEESIKFFFNGSPLISYTNHSLYIPSYFIQRDIQKTIVNKVLSSSYGLFVITGSRFSGKTYLLTGIMQSISNDNVFIFGNELSLPDDKFKEILSLNNKIFIFDTLSYTKEQFEILVNEHSKIKENNNKFILAMNLGDEELFSIIANNFIKRNLTNDNFVKFDLSNKLNFNERKQINKLYPKLDLPVIHKEKSCLDHLLEVESENYINQERYNSTFLSPSYKLIALLIILAIKEKIYTSEIKLFDFDDEIKYLITYHPNIVQKEFTLHLERSKLDLSQFKYSLISSYLLRRILGTFSKNINNYDLIFMAYDYIIKKIDKVYANKYKRIKLIKHYIYFNNINNAFLDKSKGKLSLIKEIYEKIHPLLANEPHFLHQHAKCLINYAIKSNHLSEKERINYLRLAFQKCNVAISIIDNPENEQFYSKITISNIHYTAAVIQVLICKNQNYENLNDNQIALDKLEKVLLSEGFIPRAKKNDRIDDINEFIKQMINSSLLDEDEKSRVFYIKQLLLNRSIIDSSFYGKNSSFHMYTTKAKKF